MFKKKTNAKVSNGVADVMTKLDDIYTNKSGDEYKISGDITKSPVYDKIQRMTADLTLLDGYSKMDADELKKMFNALHRPIFKKAVTDYIHNHTPETAMLTAYFTVGYRVLIGELSRIYTSTEATEKGFKYKPTKVSRQQDMHKFIRVFNNKSDEELSRSVRATTKSVLVKESFMMEGFIGSAAAAAAALGVVADKINPILTEIGAWISLIFGSVSELNPVSLISSILSSSYDNKVDKYDEAAAMYLATKEAYEEYMKIPEAQRDKKIESKYMKNLDKYNIRMENLRAKIEHYDQRALKEAKDSEKKYDAPTSTPSTSSSSSSDDSDSSSPKSDDNNDSSSSSSDGDSDWDF